jgi:hypothetical protein
LLSAPEALLELLVVLPLFLLETLLLSLVLVLVLLLVLLLLTATDLVLSEPRVSVLLLA